MNRTIRDIHDLAANLKDSDFSTARRGAAGCPGHVWGRVETEVCEGDLTAFRTCQHCYELQDCNVSLLADAILNEASGVAC